MLKPTIPLVFSAAIWLGVKAFNLAPLKPETAVEDINPIPVKSRFAIASVDNAFNLELVNTLTTLLLNAAAFVEDSPANAEVVRLLNPFEFKAVISLPDRAFRAVLLNPITVADAKFPIPVASSIPIVPALSALITVLDSPEIVTEFKFVMPDVFRFDIELAVIAFKLVLVKFDTASLERAEATVDVKDANTLVER